MTSGDLKKRYDTKEGQELERELATDLRNCVIPDDELLKNLGLFLSPGALGRIMFIQFLYEKILHRQGIIAEFGCRYGQNLNLFMALRGIHEPYNRLRKIVGFDTFSGFVKTDAKDNDNKEGDYAVPQSYEEFLEAFLAKMEHFSPLSHLKKFEVIKGDASKTVPKYIEKNPHTIFSLCYFDLDVYAPTKDVLRSIKPRLGKGTVLAFDELNCPEFPGETIAVREVLGLSRYALRRDPSNPLISYLVVD